MIFFDLQADAEVARKTMGKAVKGGPGSIFEMASRAAHDSKDTGALGDGTVTET